jgi:outer membrane protein OmpA-like peptidoglycan-associated protein
MKPSHSRFVSAWFVSVAIAGVVMGGLPGVLLGQQAIVTSDAARVVVEGDYVRVETPEGTTAVSGDWRTGATVRVGDTDALLVELGAVPAADHIRLSLGGDILFALGSAVITEAAEATLRKVAQVIRDRALGDVLVVGHTDSVGSAASNQRLSEARAVSVIRWLQQHEGIPAAILVGRGMGERQPVAAETSAGGQARNRRVELFLGTTRQADVRAAAGLVTVRSAAGEVHIGDDTVEVGGVRIDAAGVHVGGAAAGGARPAVSGATTCAAGRFCAADCPAGNCKMTCSAGATCEYGCAGGGCEMACSAGASCELGCAGGSCRFSCAVGSSCETSCLGGNCTRR